MLLIHQQHVEDPSVIAVVHNPAVVEDLPQSSILSDEREADIIIGMSISLVDLPPDAFLDILLFRLGNQIAEASIDIGVEFVDIITACELDHLLVCKEKLIVLRICLVNQKCTGQMGRNILYAKPSWVLASCGSLS